MFFADLKVAFALFDKDGDGAITVSELLSVMKSLGFKSDDMMVKKMIDRFDYDGEYCYRPQRSCGRVIFSEVCVIYSVRRGGGHAWPEGMRGRGGHAWWGKTAIAAGGTHPTGMHSCIITAYN